MKIFWRSVAITVTLVWTIVFFASLAFPLPEIKFSTMTLFFSTMLPLISIIASIVLIFYPMQFYLYAAMCWIWGLTILIDSASTSAILMYLLGCAFAYNKHFFSKRESKHDFKHDPIKYLILLVPLVIVIVFQYRLGSDMVVASILNFLFLLVFFVFMYFLVIDPFFIQKKLHSAEQVDVIDLSGLTPEEIVLVKEMVANKTFTTIGQDNEKHRDNAEKIDLSVLTLEEIEIVKEVVLGNKIFKTIAKNTYKGESTIKQMMTGIYEKLQITNKGHLVQLYKDGKLIFPE